MGSGPREPKIYLIRNLTKFLSHKSPCHHRRSYDKDSTILYFHCSTVLIVAQVSRHRLGWLAGICKKRDSHILSHCHDDVLKQPCKFTKFIQTMPNNVHVRFDELSDFLVVPISCPVCSSPGGEISKIIHFIYM